MLCTGDMSQQLISLYIYNTRNVCTCFLLINKFEEKRNNLSVIVYYNHIIKPPHGKFINDL